MMQTQIRLNLLLLCCQVYLPVHGVSSPRSAAMSIAEQLIFGVKRVLYYMNTLLEKCDNVEDLNQWILFMEFYLKCDSEAHPSMLRLSSGNDGDSLGRLDELCTAWPKRRKCSSRLASKLNSCLDSQLEEGMAGTNAFRLADAQMKFICRHKHEYTRNVEAAIEITDDTLPFEKRPLTCFREIKESMTNCIARGELLTKKFCSNFNLAKDCVLNTAMRHCKNHAAKSFLYSMLEQLQADVQCTPVSTTNEIGVYL